MTKVYSKTVQDLILCVLSDAERFRRENDAEIADSTLLNLISEQGEGYLYAAADQLELSANYHGRMSIAVLFGGDAYPVNLADCWEARCLSAQFREQSALCDAEQATTPADLYEHSNVRWIPSSIHNLALALWKLYLVGRESYIKEFAPIFELFDLRQDLTYLGLSDVELQAYDISVCVTLLLARENAEETAVVKLLSAIPVFQGISEFWGNDSEFSRFTVRASQWHIDYCLNNSGTFARFADVPPDVLFPSWIFALDKFRQKHLNRPSALGDHELLSLGADVIAGVQAQSYPRLRSLGMAESHYLKRFGNNVFNPLPFWEKFLSDDI